MMPTKRKRKRKTRLEIILGSINKSTSFANRECKIAFFNSCKFFKPIILLSVNTSSLPLYFIKAETF